jgi:coenzyme F420-reducing hydrogenase gamma subunit
MQNQIRPIERTAASPGSGPALAVWKFSSCDGCQLTLRNFTGDLAPVVYPRPEYLDTLRTSTPIKDYVPVDFTCVLVAHGTLCLGPVTQAGCGALCLAPVAEMPAVAEEDPTEEERQS